MISRLLKDLMRVEMSSTAGRVNLLGGILVIIFALLAFVESFFEKIVNSFLLSFDKQPLPVIPSGYILLFLILVLIYFYFCVRVISETEKR